MPLYCFFFALQRSEEGRNAALGRKDLDNGFFVFSLAVFLSFLSCLHICFKRRGNGTNALDQKEGISEFRNRRDVLGGIRVAEEREETKHNVLGCGFEARPEEELLPRSR